MNTNQSKTDKVIEVAGKIEQISSLVSTGGTALNYAGQALVLLGSSTSWAAGAGAALIATGQVMQKVGKVVELVGNYGQMAANVTKTAAYAADGNIAGALQSAASAIQTGAAAVASSKDLGKTFDSIDKQANKATQKLAANAAARETVNEMVESGGTEALGGMSKKQARKAISSQLQEQMGNVTTDKKWALGQMNDLKDKFTSSTDGTNSIAMNALNNSKEQYGNLISKAGGKVEDGVVSGLGRKAKKAVNKEFAGSFSNTKVSSGAAGKKFDFEKLVSGLGSTAAIFGQFQQQYGQDQNYSNTGSGYVEQWDLANDPMFQKIKRSNDAYARMGGSYV